MKKKLISGILATMFLVTVMAVAFPARVSAFPGGTVKIGIVGPKGWIPWDGLWGAARIARDLINKEAEFSSWSGQKGINTVNGLAKVELVDIDEHSFPMPAPALAVDELIHKLHAHPDMQFLIGGFRTECVAPMEETALDYAAAYGRPIWFICGAASDSLISLVKTNYGRYKYMFRVTPTNSSVMGVTFAGFIGQLVAPKLAQLYYDNPATLVPTYIIAENLVWCDSMVAFLQDYAAYFGMTIVGTRRPNPVATDFSADIAAAEAANAKIVIHAFSSLAGANFIKQYGAMKPSFACIGINVESQMQEFYESVGGACEYETILASTGIQDGFTAAESMNPDARPLTSNVFWDIYNERYHVLWDDPPIYTAWSAYDAIIALNETSYDPVGSGQASAGNGWSVWLDQGDIAKLIEHIETLGVSDGFAWKRVLMGGSYFRSGILGYFKFTGTNGAYHDPFCSIYSFTPLHDGVVRPLVVQWQAGRMEVVWPRDRLYSRKWMFPEWMYSLETDFAGGDPVPTGFGDYYTTPDTIVDVCDLDALATAWFQEPPYTFLEADMQPYDHFIDVYDATRIARDWMKTATPQ